MQRRWEFIGMTASDDAKTKIVGLMETHGFTGETRFYRYTLPEFLEPLEEPGTYRISANADPSEAVVNVYAGGHISLAAQVGSGLAFAESADNDWMEPGRTGVEIRLQDALDQGGRIYPVESVITSRIWYLTLPEGGVRVRKIEG
jgi:hypothetical protein